MPDRDAPERLPPHSRDAERSVLGSMLRDNAVIPDVINLVRPEHFYADAHQKICQAIYDLFDRGQAIDLVLLSEILKDRKQIEDVGNYGYLGELWEAAPTAANAEYYARIVRDKAVVRGLIHASTEILRDAYDQTEPADQLLESAERKVMEIAQRGMTGQTYHLEEVLREAYDRIDARHMQGAASVSGIPTGFADLDNITAGLQNSEMIIIAARPSVGKCLAADSEILLDDGSIATIEEIYHRQRARLFSLGPDWRFRVSEPSAFVDDGIRPVFRVTTRLGRVVETTASHPFRTLDGWRPLAELTPGECVAVPRQLPVFGDAKLREGEVKLLAYLIGDGGLTDTTPEFTNSNPRLREDFTQAITELGGLRVRCVDSNGTRTPSLCVSGDPTARAESRLAFAANFRTALRQRTGTDRELARAVGVSSALVCVWKQGDCLPSANALQRLSAILGISQEALLPDWKEGKNPQQRNPLTEWLRKLGLWGKDAHAKCVPEVVFRLIRPQLALFLNRLFATDGWATVLSDGNGQLGYGTVCDKLARQVQHLLLRFGIIASLRLRNNNYRGTRRPSWQLDITDRQSVQIFASEIGMFGKEAALARVVQAFANRRFKPNRDVVPAGVWHKLAAAKGAESWASLAGRAGSSNRTNLHVGKRGISRPRLLRFARALGNVELQQLAQSDVYWDRIVSIEPVGRKQVYDLTIPDDHNFVANDICVHNTAFSLNLVRHIVTEENQPVFFVSLEQSRIELAERLLCSQAKVNSHNLRKGHLSGDDMQKLIEAGGILKRAPLYIDDSPGQGMLRIAANARRLKLRNNLRLVVIDYLQLIEPENRRDPRQEQVAQISRRLKFLARELEIPVIALAQVNRASEDRQDHRPRLADLRESGSIEQDADTVMILHRPEMHEPGQNDGIIEVIIAKQRNGPTGEVTLTYLKQFMRYENHAPDDHYHP